MGYPDNLHDEHSDYALLPENRKVKPQMLSKHQRKLAEEYDINVDANSRAPKLICSLYDKVSIPHPHHHHYHYHIILTSFFQEKYVLHTRLLQQAIRFGMVLKKVHRVLSFTQSCWLKPYIEKNTELRIKNKDSPFDYWFYKLLNNSFYGLQQKSI